MLARLQHHLSFANVVSLMALFIALSGGAYALAIPRHSVGAQQLKRDAVTRAKIRNGAVTSSKVRDRSLRAADFKPGQLPTGEPGPRGEQGPAGQDATRLFAYIRDVSGSETATIQYGSGAPRSTISPGRTATG